MPAVQPREATGHACNSMLSDVYASFFLHEVRPCFNKSPKSQNRTLGQPLSPTGRVTSDTCLTSFPSPSSPASNGPRHPTTKRHGRAGAITSALRFCNSECVIGRDYCCWSGRPFWMRMGKGQGDFDGEINSEPSASQANNNTIFQHLQV